MLIISACLFSFLLGAIVASFCLSSKQSDIEIAAFRREARHIEEIVNSARQSEQLLFCLDHICRELSRYENSAPGQIAEHVKHHILKHYFDKPDNIK